MGSGATTRTVGRLRAMCLCAYSAVPSDRVSHAHPSVRWRAPTCGARAACGRGYNQSHMDRRRSCLCRWPTVSGAKYAEVAETAVSRDAEVPLHPTIRPSLLDPFRLLAMMTGWAKNAPDPRLSLICMQASFNFGGREGGYLPTPGRLRPTKPLIVCTARRQSLLACARLHCTTTANREKRRNAPVRTAQLHCFQRRRMRGAF